MGISSMSRGGLEEKMWAMAGGEEGGVDKTRKRTEDNVYSRMGRRVRL
jgi:hypothetical protein